MTTNPRPSILPLDEAEMARLDEQRAWLTAEVQHDPAQSGSPLDAIQGVLDSGLIRVDETWKLQGLGVVFGDAVATELNLQWVIVEDEYGRDPALLVDRENDVLLFPLTMISKRVEAGERVDVHQLFQALTADVRTRFLSR